MQESKNDVYSIYYDNLIRSVVMEWNGYATSRQFREGTELMLNMLIKNNAYKVLADIKNMSIIGMEDQKWLEEDFLPRAIAFGFKAIAMVKPVSYFNNVAVENVSYKVNKEKLNIVFFDDVNEARQWLTTV